MRKLSAFLIICLLVLTSVTYLYYSHWHREQQAEKIVPYIPKSAALVYEVGNLGEQWAHFKQTAIAATLNQVPALVTIQNSLKFIGDLIGDAQYLDTLPLTVSVHGLGEEKLGYIFYLDTNNAATQALFEAISRKVQQENTYTEVVRQYAGYKLITLSSQDTNQQLVYIKKDQYIIASYASLLIEDVVRGLTGKQKSGLRDFRKTSSNVGSLYVSFSQLPQLLRVFVKHDQANKLGTTLATLASTSHLNLKLTKHNLLLSGFAKDDAATSPYLMHTLHGQAAGAMPLAAYLPQDTAMLQHFTFSDAEQFLMALRQYRSQPTEDTTATTQDIRLLEDTLYPLLQGEIGYCARTTKQHSKENKLVFMKVEDPQAFIAALKAFNLLIPWPQQAQKSYEIYQLATSYFQHWLPGLLFPNFEAHYITQADNYIILAHSHADLQKWYAQHQHRENWHNTSNYNTWLGSTLEQAQFSLLIDIKKTWPQIMQSLRPTWKKIFKTHADALQWFKITCQLLCDEDTGCYMSILLNDTGECMPLPSQAHQESPHKPKAATVSTVFQTEDSIINRPWLVSSHRRKGHHILLQDASYRLYFLDPSGKLLWKKKLEGPIATDLFEMDYYKNAKVQYLFSTNQCVHWLDYYGHEVSRYPHPLPRRGQPVGLRVVDYNRNKNYRLLIATPQGNIYLKDKHYQPLPAWNPKSLGKGFIDTPMHIRVQGKDYFLALQKDGVLQALNRQGQSYAGFPVKLQTHTRHPLLVQPGNTPEATSLIVLTDAGQCMRLNLAGDVQEVIQLACPTNACIFDLCSNQAMGYQYVITRQDGDKLAIMNEKGDLRFELPQDVQNPLLQYYHFDDCHQCYVITDKDKKRTYIYDHTGRLLQDMPWHNSHAVSLHFSESDKALHVYVGSNTSLEKYVLSY
ncbi:MAG: hypothetical protein ACX93T_02800 [Bacteroidota bacterium]